MMNMEGFGNPFMPFGAKFDDSADDGEFEDEDEDFDFDDEEGGYDLDDDYDEGDMIDVKPPISKNGLLEGISGIILKPLLHPIIETQKIKLKINYNLVMLFKEQRDCFVAVKRIILVQKRYMNVQNVIEDINISITLEDMRLSAQVR